MIANETFNYILCQGKRGVQLHEHNVVAAAFLLSFDRKSSVSKNETIIFATIKTDFFKLLQYLLNIKLYSRFHLKRSDRYNKNRLREKKPRQFDIFRFNGHVLLVAQHRFVSACETRDNIFNSRTAFVA